MKYLTLEEAGIFHGHLGPFLVLGYMAGEIAKEILKPKSEFDLHAEVILPLRRPYTCVVDGVQCSTKCTLGKLNIELRESKANSIELVFRSKVSGRVVRIKVKDGIISKLLSFSSLDEAVNWLRSLPRDKIFEIIVE